MYFIFVICSFSRKSLKGDIRAFIKVAIIILSVYIMSLYTLKVLSNECSYHIFLFRVLQSIISLLGRIHLNVRFLS